MDIARLRSQIPVCQRLVYVNTGWSGPSPLPVVDAIKARLDYEMEQGPTTPDVLESGKHIQEEATDAAARLLSASPEEVCLTENTTQGLNIVLNGLDWHEGDEIINCNLEHGSVLVPGYFLRERHGAVVKTVDLAPDESWEVILGKIEGALTDRTRLIFLSHIEYSCGLRMPVQQIRRLTKDRGVLMLLDGAQAAGHIPLDMKEIDCDFYSIPGQKWLLGSEGVGALYISREMVSQVRPIHVGWGAVVDHHDDPLRFEPNVDEMKKFYLSSSSAALRAGFMEAIRFIQDIGIEEIEAGNLDLATAFKQALGEVPGVEILSPMDRTNSCGLVSFTIEGMDPVDAVARMWSEHRIVARPVSYPQCVRVSLHFFNTEEEVDQIVKAVRGLA